MNNKNEFLKGLYNLCREHKIVIVGEGHFSQIYFMTKEEMPQKLYDNFFEELDNKIKN